MMQIESLVLYSRRGERRVVRFRLGRLNVITGDSQTGKSSLTNIFRYCLGSKRPDVPFGRISSTVAWYALVVNIDGTRLFLGRPAADGSEEVSAAMLLVEPEELPAFDELQANTTAAELRHYLASGIGIEENLHVPAYGQTRAALEAGFKHSLYYCFQGQGEVANPEVLFHRQNREWQSQAIRDTLPYFLGAQGLDDLRRRQQLTAQRRLLRSAQQRLTQAQDENGEGMDRIGGLLVEARDAGLTPTDPPETPDVLDIQTGRTLLRLILDQPLEPASFADSGAEFESVRLELASQRDRARDILDQLRGLESFTEVASGYADELGEHRARLNSIGLIPDDLHEAECPICGSQLVADPEVDDTDDHEVVLAELDAVSRRLALAGRDRPRVEKARAELLAEREAVRLRIAELNETLTALVDTSDLLQREQERVNIQSYIRGKIAEHLSTSEAGEPADIAVLQQEITRLRASVAELEESLDPELLRSSVDSAVAIVSRDVTAIARVLGLEHSQDGVRVDVNRLTVVADTVEGPAYLDAGQIGSGFNWVGYHLAVYLAFQRYFISRSRPVPRFVLIDQPSQAFFPPDRKTGGDLDELSSTDRQHTKDLYRLMYDEAAAREGALQLIALDHADFDDAWFQDCVVERWRSGEALIPPSWLEESGLQPPGDPDAATGPDPQDGADPDDRTSPDED
jgi:hypothetical protein